MYYLKWLWSDFINILYSEGQAFPLYFKFLHQYLDQLLQMDPDSRIVSLDADFDTLVGIFSAQPTNKLSNNKSARRGNPPIYTQTPTESPRSEGTPF